MITHISDILVHYISKIFNYTDVILQSNEMLWKPSNKTFPRKV